MQDQVIGALCAWRENRGGGTDGMQSVLNVLMNRAAARGTTVYEEALRPWQFSSMTGLADPQLARGPNTIAAGDIQTFVEAFDLAQQAANGTLADMTGGAVSYYAESMKTPPVWAASMTRTVIIAGQVFFKDV